MQPEYIDICTLLGVSNFIFLTWKKLQHNLTSSIIMLGLILAYVFVCNYYCGLVQWNQQNDNLMVILIYKHQEYLHHIYNNIRG